jgi:hypothetical protein
VNQGRPERAVFFVDLPIPPLTFKLFFSDSIKMSLLIIGIVLVICGSVGLVLKIQEIRERYKSES